MRPSPAAPSLVGVLLLAGCYAAHGAPRRDASIEPIDAAIDAAVDAVDAGVDAGLDAGRDAGLDAGLCVGVSIEPLLHLCSFESQGALPAGEPATLSLFRAECVCADSRGCDVRVDGTTIELDTWRCPESEECDDCTADLACAIPPLAPGVYGVQVDGLPVATIAAVSGPPIARPTCWDVQDDLVEVRCAGSPVAFSPREICHRPLEDVGTQVEITLAQTVPACIVPAECRATLEGRRIVVTATALTCAGADGCGGPSVERIARCITPPLRDGDYTILVEGSAIESPLRIRDITGRGEVVCASVP
jgi:hypothetical protein